MNISFVYPQFLFALLLIVIPILIHLFNFRRFKKVYFTNVRFLRDIKEETTSRSKLKHLLVLLSRILAVSFLVFAFAQPFIPSPTIKKIAAERAVSIFIDNSFSMDAVTKEGSLLDVAKKKAREVVMAYKPSDRFQLLTNNFDPVNQRLVNRDEFLELVDQVKISPYSRKLKDILSRQKDALQVSGSPEKKSFILSDFQESMADLNETGTDTAIAVTLIPVQTENVSNVFVDSCWFSSPILQINQPVELNVRVRNYGNLDREAIPVKLLINGLQKVVATVSVNAGNYTDTKLTFTPSVTGWQKGEVLIDDNPITFDDQYFFSFKIAEQLNILHIFAKQKGNYLKALFGASAYFHLNETDEKQLDYSSLSNQNLIILDEVPVISSGLSAEIKKYLTNGGSLVVFPDSALDFNSFGNFLNEIGAEKFTAIESGGQQKIDKLTLEDPLFNGVFSSGNKIDESTDLPLVDKYFSQPSTSGSKRENLMVMRNGLPLLSRYRIGKGATYLFAVPLSGTFSNLSRHAIFVPVMYRIALLSERPAVPAYFIGKDDQMELSAVTTSGEQVFHLVNQDKKFDVIPAHRETTGGTVIDINNQVTEAGAYDLKLNDKLVSVFAFNFNRDESVMRFNDIASLNDQINALRLKNFVTLKSDQVDITSSISTMNDGKLLWKYCIILVLLFLALETLLLKFWKQ